VNLLRDDSRDGLRKLFRGWLRERASQTVFFYLDAHWNEDLPLAEELEIVFRNCPAAVVMIDDFQVPGDPEYAFDDYGPGKALTPEYLSASVAAHELATYYPSRPASEEGGSRRGCVVLAKAEIHGVSLSSLPLLRRA